MTDEMSHHHTLSRHYHIITWHGNEVSVIERDDITLCLSRHHLMEGD